MFNRFLITPYVLLLTLNSLLDFIPSNIHSLHFNKIPSKAIDDLPWLLQRWLRQKIDSLRQKIDSLKTSVLIRSVLSPAFSCLLSPSPDLTKHLNAKVLWFLPLVCTHPSSAPHTKGASAQHARGTILPLFSCTVMVPPLLHTWLLFWRPSFSPPDKVLSWHMFLLRCPAIAILYFYKSLVIAETSFELFVYFLKTWEII